MEADSKSAVIIETGQEIGSLDVNKSGDAELLSDGQSDLQRAMIIYDNESQEGQVVKLITNIKSEVDASDENPDPDNVITLHASSNDSKDETIEENVVAMPSQQIIKTEAPSKPDEEDADTDDDETIATFVTSTGQQLALYAVEDSDEIFAVALYDESGEPPTNFHFLMKSDVERLIGEGAVKTVKKPSAQSKKQPKTEKKEEEIKFERVSQPPVAASPAAAAPVEKKEDILEKSMAAIKTEIVEVPQPQPKVQEVKVQQQPTPPPAKKEVAPPKVVAKNQHVNNKSLTPARQIVKQTKPAVAQVRHVVTQAKPVTTQTKFVATPTRPVVVGQSRPVKQVVTQARHIVTQPRQIVTQQRQFVAQPARQIVTQQRQIVSQPTRQQIVAQPTRKFVAAQPTRQFVAQTKQLILPTRQYVNQTKQYVGKQIVYQAKPAQPMRTAVTPLKKPAAVVMSNPKEKVTYVLQNQDESYVLDLDSDAEILEQSTVQYILCDENPSDSELTFDELQASIQSFKTSSKSPAAAPAPVKTIVELPKPVQRKEPIAKFSPIVRATPTKSATILTPKKQQPTTTTTTPVYRTYKSPKKARTTNNLLQAHRKIKQEVMDPLYGDFDDSVHDMSDDAASHSRANSTLDSSTGGVGKAKRSRKQQLTVVNRGDSEIIIQPASAYSEEEDEPVVQRRRGRRKKKSTPDPDYNPRQAAAAKKGRRSARLVEVIDIDVDESANVITLDGKKGSSDKENDDVISLGDTDEEDDDDEEVPRKKKPAIARKPMMQCSHCMRNFRKRRVLERHVQICPKSPAHIEKLEERKKLGVDKKFKCKSCDEYFDIAVALARHVRVVHSPRKRGRPPTKGWRTRGDKSETDVTDESMDESSPEREVAAATAAVTKRKGRPARKSSVSKETKETKETKEVEKSPAPEVESKSSEPPADATPQPQPAAAASSSSEPRRRGRPPGKRSFYVEKSVTPELDDSKAASSDEKKPEAVEPLKKRGRPPKRSTSQEAESEDAEEKPTTTTTTEEASESSTLPKKRGRPKKKSLSKDEETDGEELPKKRGRYARRTLSKDEDDAKSTESEEKVEDEAAKKLGEAEEKSASDEPAKRRGRPPRDKLISIKEEKITESSEPEETEEEPRKRGRAAAKSAEPEPAKKIKTEMVDEMEEVVLSPSQTGKLRKLNCGECGKWFSSVAALNSHQLHQHRTKKSAITVKRCTDCNALVPSNAFAKHMSMQHGKSVASTSAAADKSDAATPSTTTTTTTTPEQSDEKTAKVVQRSLRSSN